jgi:hypothetical protein
MPSPRDFAAFHKTISDELLVTQDRMRNLIGDAHWLTDGEHREAVLRKVLRNHIPETYHVGKGFVALEHGTSTQIDILVTHKEHPTLFKDGDLRIVTPDAVRAIVEVKKTIRSRSELKKVLQKLADNAEKIRRSNTPISSCWAGLFVFDNPQDTRNQNRIDHQAVLKTLNQVADRRKERIVNVIALGPDDFFRFWDQGKHVSSPVPGPVWHSYELEHLAFSYFVGNLVIDHLAWERSFKSEYAWYPVEGGKETRRRYFIGLSNAQARGFQ